MRFGAALQTKSGLLIVSESKTHCELLLAAQQEGLNVDQTLKLGWIDVESWRATPRPEWPGLTPTLTISPAPSTPTFKLAHQSAFKG